jgi:hypothetical protein
VYKQYFQMLKNFCRFVVLLMSFCLHVRDVALYRDEHPNEHYINEKKIIIKKNLKQNMSLCPYK